jgi:hypothetical protein
VHDQTAGWRSVHEALVFARTIRTTIRVLEGVEVVVMTDVRQVATTLLQIRTQPNVLHEQMLAMMLPTLGRIDAGTAIPHDSSRSDDEGIAAAMLLSKAWVVGCYL